MRLSITNASKFYRSGRNEVRAVDDLSLDVDNGRFVAIQGPSGCGKSTLLLLAGGLLKPDSGTVKVDDQNLYTLGANDRAALRNKQVGFVFQQFHLVPYLSVEQNILSPSLANGAADGAADKAKELISRFGLSDRAKHRPGQLSSGERQRTALARALLNGPSLVLADEPTGNLDEENSKVVLEHLREFTNAGGSVLLVTHDPQAAEAADQVHQIKAGKLVA